MGGPVVDFLTKSAIFLVDIEVVSFIKIVGYVDIWVKVSIKIGDQNTKTKSDKTSVNAGFFADIHKFTVVIAQQHIAHTLKNIWNTFPVLRPYISLFRITKAANGDVAIVEDIGVQIPILVIIKKGGMCGKACFGQVVFFCFFGKGQIPIVDVEVVIVVIAFHVPCITDIDVQKAIVVDVHHNHSRGPRFVTKYPGLL